MLKILHTADWHIGQSLAGFPRLAEHRLALAALVEIAVDERVDAVIVAGDVFDTQSPKAEAETLLYETLASLHRARPGIPVIMVAGNHDLAGRIEAPSPLYRAFGVRSVGSVHRLDGRIDLDRHLVPLPDAAGVVQAHCLALPYPRSIDLPGVGLAGDEGGSAVVREVRRLYAEAVLAARERIGDMPLVATGHLHVQGALESEGAERAILVGGQDAAPADIFPPDLAYVALGHLHRPQAVGRETIRYAGSLFPLSATERGYDHGVAIVTLEAGATRIRHRPIRRPAAFHRLPDRGALAPEAIEAAVAALALDPATPEALRPFVQVVLHLDGPRPGLEGELDRLSQRFAMRFVGHLVERPAGAATAAEDLAAIQEPLSARNPADLFAAAFEKQHGRPPDPEHQAVFVKALAMARGD